MSRRVVSSALPRLPRALALVLSTAVLLFAVACGDDSVPGKAPPPPAPAKTAGPAGPPPAALPPTSAKLATPPAETADDGKPLPEGASSRWYEVRLDGKRMSTLHVVWTPSKWKDKKTIRDVTTQRSASAREMGPMVDVFTSQTVSETERGEDGALWWMRSSTREAERLTVSQLTWTGDGYDSVATLNGVEERKRVPAAEPTSIDAEGFLGARIARGELKPGDRLTLRLAHVPKQKVVEHALEVIGPDTWNGPDGPLPCLKVRQTDPETKSEDLLWFDAQGVIARIKSGSTEVRRITEATARARQAEPASFSITLEASPVLERAFSADKMWVDVHLKGDPDRPLPDFPASPWSRPLGVEGSDAAGWVIHMEFRAYDAPEDAHATIPVQDPAFAKDLESTLLMPCNHDDVQAAAKKALNGETDARKAVAKLSEFVFTRLRKQSGPVPDATAVEILRDRRGDCSEHALLFVALCRAAGIPARRCSGYVCVGSLWGGHAWAEVWVGAWMGVDPTTNDVGTAARYLFHGYEDDPDSYPHFVSSRVQRRMTLETVRLEEGDEVVDLRDPKRWRVVDEAKGRADDRLAGLSFRDLPKDWHVSLGDKASAGSGDAELTGPGFTAAVGVTADQGYRGPRILRHRARIGDAKERLFAGAPAVAGKSGQARVVVVASRRRIVEIRVEAVDAAKEVDLDAVLRQLETVMAATFTPKPDGK